LICCRDLKGFDFLQEYTGVLRNISTIKQSNILKDKESKYTTSIHALISAILKISRKTEIPSARKVYRGLSGIVLDEKWSGTNAQGAKGGMELGFLSTTLNQNVALEYLGKKQGHSILLAIEIGDIDNGASLGCLSQYPGQ
jgi:hypothetical protein